MSLPASKRQSSSTPDSPIYEPLCAPLPAPTTSRVLHSHTGTPSLARAIRSASLTSKSSGLATSVSPLRSRSAVPNIARNITGPSSAVSGDSTSAHLGERKRQRVRALLESEIDFGKKGLRNTKMDSTDAAMAQSRSDADDGETAVGSSHFSVSLLDVISDPNRRDSISVLHQHDKSTSSSSRAPLPHLHAADQLYKVANAVSPPSPNTPPASQMNQKLETPSASSRRSLVNPVGRMPPLSAYTCPICFSPPTNATLTPCGHVCCGACLFTAVKTTMQRTTMMTPEQGIARCPICRAPIPGWNGRGGGVIGLQIRAVLTL